MTLLPASAYTGLSQWPRLFQSATTGTASNVRLSDQHSQNTDPSQPLVYQIRLKGHLGCMWTDWFGGLSITWEDNGDTLLTGPVIDQAALFGLLKKVRDLGMPLVSVNPLEPGPADA